MTVDFLKLQIAGNGFLLIETERNTGLTPDRYAMAARLLCDIRYGIGASGVIFVSADMTTRYFSAKGVSPAYYEDALLCAARFIFDSGRIQGKDIMFKTASGEQRVRILGAHQFALSCGSPFSLIGGHIIERPEDRVIETIEHDGSSISCAALHIREDAVVAFPQNLRSLDYRGLSSLIGKAFPGRRILPVIARTITSDTLVVLSRPRGSSSACTIAASSLVASVCAGIADRSAVILFESASSAMLPSAIIEKDRDFTRRLAVSWDREDNELTVIGSGGYLFEGKADLPFGADNPLTAGTDV